MLFYINLYAIHMSVYTSKVTWSCIELDTTDWYFDYTSAVKVRIFFILK